eukprot:Nk52_evm21s78 gene=Nk52_evmTU21s78
MTTGPASSEEPLRQTQNQKAATGKEPHVTAGCRPSVAPSLVCGGSAQLRAQTKTSQKVGPWVWVPFTNPARDDTLELSHWRKAQDVGKIYPFHLFNISIDVPQYSDEEYNTLIHTTRLNWTKKETDYLFDMCRKWDLRWPVIFDRWELAPRSMEDMKEQYYEVCHKLAFNRMSSLDYNDKSTEHLKYDAVHESERRKQLQRIFSRSRLQAQEEQSLAVDFASLDELHKERDKERVSAKKLLTVLEAKLIAKGLPASVGASVSKVDKSPKRKKKKTVPAVFGLDSVKAVLSTGGAVNNDGGALNEAPIVDAFSGIEKPFLSNEVLKVRKEKSTGTYLRSVKALTPISTNPVTQSKTDKILEELDVGTKPMPTGPVLRLYDDLRGDLLLLLELKKHVDAREYEVSALKYQGEELKRLTQGMEPLTPAKEKEIAVSVEKSMDPDVSFMAQFLKKEKLTKKVDKENAKAKEKKEKQTKKKKEKEKEKEKLTENKKGKTKEIASTEASTPKPKKKAKTKKDKGDAGTVTDIDELLLQMKESDAKTPKKKTTTKKQKTSKVKSAEKEEPKAFADHDDVMRYLGLSTDDATTSKGTKHLLDE